MDPERNAATLQRLHDEVSNGHNVDAADELIHHRPARQRPDLARSAAQKASVTLPQIEKLC